MHEPLYNKDILRLAASTAGLTRLAHPQATAERRSPVCGSRISVDVEVDESGKIAAFGAEVRACAMGQASAALLARRAVGLDRMELERAAEGLSSLLKEGVESIENWPEFLILKPASTRPARHAAILLPFEAAIEAVARATSA